MYYSLSDDGIEVAQPNIPGRKLLSLAAPNTCHGMFLI